MMFPIVSFENRIRKPGKYGLSIRNKFQPSAPIPTVQIAQHSFFLFLYYPQNTVQSNNKLHIESPQFCRFFSRSGCGLKIIVVSLFFLVEFIWGMHMKFDFFSTQL